MPGRTTKSWVVRTGTREVLQKRLGELTAWMNEARPLPGWKNGEVVLKTVFENGFWKELDTTERAKAEGVDARIYPASAQIIIPRYKNWKIGDSKRADEEMEREKNRVEEEDRDGLEPGERRCLVSYDYEMGQYFEVDVDGNRICM